jgi:hypothetical protein
MVEVVHLWNNSTVVIFIVEFISFYCLIPGLMQVKLKEFEDRFDQLDQMRVDESLRPEKLVNNDILGFYGNFKKLDVD